MGFDHRRIINEAYADLKAKSLSEPIIFELLPNKFTVKELQDVYESILGIEIDNRNFRRKLLTKKYLIELDEKQVGISKKTFPTFYVQQGYLPEKIQGKLFDKHLVFDLFAPIT